MTVQCRIFALSVLQAVTCNAEKQTVPNGRSLCNYFAYASTIINDNVIPLHIITTDIPLYMITVHDNDNVIMHNKKVPKFSKHSGL